jgi:hypothetical protein
MYFLLFHSILIIIIYDMKYERMSHHFVTDVFFLLFHSIIIIMLLNIKHEEIHIQNVTR